jgi:rod shape determining protein RodA
MLLKNRFLPLGISLLIFITINLLMVSSLAPQAFFKQLLAWIIGIFLFFVGTQINPKQIAGNRWPIFIVSCVLLLLPIILGNITRGSRRWIDIGTASLQPSEIVKPGLMLFLASGSLPYLHLLPVAIILAQPDLGSAFTVLVLLIPIILYTPKLLKLSILLGLFCLLLSPFTWRFLLHDYQKNRIATFLNPTHDPLGQGYNLIQSQIAIGSGGLFGKGYRQGTQGQLLFLPEKHTDFIFAATSEELGLVSILLIFFAYFLLLRTLLNKAFNSTNNRPLFLFTLGITLEIWIQTVVNIGMNIGLLPITGIPLPFLSVGGSSLLAFLFSLGIIYSS